MNGKGELSSAQLGETLAGHSLRRVELAGNQFEVDIERCIFSPSVFGSVCINNGAPSGWAGG